MFCLELVEVEAGYGRVKVVKGVNLSVEKGTLALLVGPNGAGKSTTAKVVTGLITPFKGKVLVGQRNIVGMKVEKIVNMGVGFVPEGRHIFGDMNVIENLLMGGVYLSSDQVEKRLKEVFQIFPIFKKRSKQIAKTLSGGEQQMLAIARALIQGPKLLILDEPFNGIAAGIVDKILEVVVNLKETGTSVLLIDQNAEAQKIADYAYAMRTGKIVEEGEPEKIFSATRMKKMFLT